MNNIIDLFYDRDVLKAGLDLAASMAMRDFHDVMVKIPTKVVKGSEIDTLANTYEAMEILCKDFIKTLEIKMMKNIDDSMRALQDLLTERDGI